MKVSSYLHADKIVLEIRSRTKEEVLGELLNPLLKDGPLTDTQGEAALSGLIERERQMSTGIDLGVAVPHCRLPFLDAPLVSMGLSKGGIDFDSYDGSPTRIFFLVLVPANQPKIHIQILSAIARLLTLEEHRKAVLSCERAADVMELIESVESSRENRE